MAQEEVSMAGPWEKYQQQKPKVDAEGPWSKFQAQPAPTQPPLKARLSAIREQAYRDMAGEAPKQYTINPDMGDDEIISKMGFDPAEIKKSSLYKPGELGSLAKSWAADPDSTVSRLFGGPVAAVGQGLVSAGRGLEQLKDKLISQPLGITSEADIKYKSFMDKLRGTLYEEVYSHGSPTGQQTPTTATKAVMKGYELLGEATPSLILPGAQGLRGAKVLSGAGGRALGKMALTGAATAAMQPVQEKPGETFAEAKLKQAAGGAAGAVGGTLAIEKALVPLVSKVVNMFRKVGEGKATPIAAQFVEDAELLGIDAYTAGQALGKGPLLSAEQKATSIPFFGPTREMARGYKQVASKAAEIEDRLQSEMRARGYAGMGQLRQAAENGDRNAVRMLTSTIPDAGDDFSRVMQASLDTEKARKSAIVESQFKAVDRLADTMGPLTLDKPRMVLEEIVDSESRLGGNSSLLSEAQDLLKRLDKFKNPKYSEVRQASDRIGQLANEWTRGIDPTKQAAAFGLRNVRDAMREEMDFYVKLADMPELTKALNSAKESYQGLLAPYKNRTVRNIMQTDQVDEAVQAIVNKKGFVHTAERLYDAMGEKGQAAFRYALLKDKIAKATSGENMSLARLASSIEDDLQRYARILRPSDLNEMQALANVARHMESSNAAYAVQQNGAKLAPVILGTAGIGLSAANAPAAGTLAGMLLIGKMFSTGPLKKFTLAASKLPPGHPELEKLVERASRYMPRIYATQTADEEQQ